MKIIALEKKFPELRSPCTPQQMEEVYEALRAIGIEPGSFYQEMEMTSPYVDTHRDTTFSNTMVQLHSHTFFEILCCTNTCGAEYLVGSERYRLQKGDIIFISPGVSHRPILPEHMTEAYKRDVLWLSMEFMELIVQTCPDWSHERKRSTDLLRTAGSPWEFLPELIHQGVREYEARLPGWQSAVVGNAMVIVTHLARAFRDPRATPLRAEQPELLDRVMAYVEDHLSEKITLSDAAQHFYVSESTISHLFRQKMGVSFYRCVTQRRLIAAKSLIAEDMVLEDIALKVGFSDYSTFYRAFKQEYGISPRQYRKRLEGMEQAP